MHHLLHTSLRSVLVLALLAGGALSDDNERAPASFSSEEERMAAYTKKGYTWPPEKVVPDTKEFRHLIMKRAEHLSEMDDMQVRG